MQKRRSPAFSRSPSTEPVVPPLPRVCRPRGVVVLLITDVVSKAANYGFGAMKLQCASGNLVQKRGLELFATDAAA